MHHAVRVVADAAGFRSRLEGGCGGVLAFASVRFCRATPLFFRVCSSFSVAKGLWVEKSWGRAFGPPSPPPFSALCYFC